jgi:hypothetical protein
MNYYEPLSRLFKKADGSKLKSHVSVQLPAGQTLKETRFVETSNPPLTTIEYGIEFSTIRTQARISEAIKEFTWDGITRDVSTEIFDPHGNSTGKNTISSSTAQIY